MFVRKEDVERVERFLPVWDVVTQTRSIPPTRELEVDTLGVELSKGDFEEPYCLQSSYLSFQILERAPKAKITWRRIEVQLRAYERSHLTGCGTVQAGRGV